MDSGRRTIGRMAERTILTADELASVRQPYRAARLLPRRVYHDPAIQTIQVTANGRPVQHRAI